MSVDRLKELIVELEGLMMSAEDLKHRAKKQFGELEHTDFAYHMATAINGADDACDEVKKMVTQMEASK
jgi:2-phospho-L-lactate transferase/gluconeogenesis factor (CofD/UPF0052 family)